MNQKYKINDKKEIYHVNYQENVKCTADGSETILEQFLSIANKRTNEDFVGTIINNKLQWQTYGQFKEKVEKFSSFLNTIVEPKEIIGIFSVNRYEWLVSEYASYMSNCINCPLYSTFGPESLNLVVNETEMKVCCVSGEKANSLLNIIKGSRKHYIEHVILYDDVCEDEHKFEEMGIKVHYFNRIMETQKISLRTEYPKSEDVATYCYTSGTSGLPKGVILTHRNFISNIAAFFRGSTKSETFDPRSDDVYLSYLPLAHVMERIVVCILISVGGKIGFYRGSPKELQKDYLIIRPTFIIAVPRVLNIFKQRIEAKLAEKSFILQFIFALALKYKVWNQKNGHVKSPILDYLIFNKIAEQFGGRLRGCLCGSASLNPHVLYFLQAVLSIRIFQGYGQTETTGATTLNPLDWNIHDSVGIAFPSNKIKLKPVEGYDEYSGEILVKGDNVTRGYYKRQKETEELFDEDGWLKTGDIGRLYNDCFKIIGRRKEIFKTSFGEYIVPEKIENLFQGGIIEDIFITGADYSNKIAAVVVSKNENVTVETIMKHINAKGLELFEQKKLNKLEIPSHAILIREGFETFVKEEFLTVTGKKKRNAIEKYFKKEIESILN